MKKSTAPFNINRKSYYVHWDAIPAWVCNQCGEAYFETEEVFCQFVGWVIARLIEGIIYHYNSQLPTSGFGGQNG